MGKIIFNTAKFIKTGVEVQDFPRIVDVSGNILPEIAVAGRSNVGKSSLLNHLFQRKNLVKTSAIPGKTQAVNFFTVDDTMTFVDLPGYGYAHVSKEMRLSWGPMVQEYLRTREQLKLILFLFDIRRVPTEDDLVFLQWVIHHQKSMILVLTKTDKVNQSDRIKNTKLIIDAFNAENLCYTHYSVLKNRGRNELIKLILDALKDEECII